MNAISATDIGQRRNVNQDYVFASKEPVGNLPNLFVVADGMGGHRAGDFASSYTVDVLLKSIREDQEYNPIKIIRTAIEASNKAIIQKSKEAASYEGMGTTIVAATIVGHYMYVANVGDSRLYLIGDTIRQITTDHSLVEEMVRIGEITRAEAKRHPDKNIITRAVGVSSDIAIDFFDLKLQKNHTILICSDGLTDMLEDEEIKEIIDRNTNLKDAASELIGKANQNGGRDNIAVILIEPFADEVKVC